MATARKKQDEKHLKILRELVSLPANKQCFDCHQRGPTYVNMTIGSFVCTSCSGMLRGLTPPHRVKSISMASFSPEEVELIKIRGNEYCKQIWLGLYDPVHGQDSKDEQQIKDFMIAKYERKRYYVDPTTISRNGPTGFSSPEVQSRSRTSTPQSVGSSSDGKPSANATPTPFTQAKPFVLNVQTSTPSHDNMFTPDKSEFLADFASADPFSSSSQAMPNTAQLSFANFDNNPVFSSSSDQLFGLMLKSDPIPSKCNTNRWSMPTASALSTFGGFGSPARKAASTMGVNQPPLLSVIQPPSEDRYAALKDLDSLMKSQQQQQQQQHQQHQQLQQQQHQQHQQQQQQQQQPVVESAAPLNDWSSGSSVDPWAPSVGSNGMTAANFSANPFRPAVAKRPNQPGFGPAADANCGWGTVGPEAVPNGAILSGMGAVFPTSQSMNFPAKVWHNPVGNPFVLGASPAPTGRSSNPFL